MINDSKLSHFENKIFRIFSDHTGGEFETRPEEVNKNWSTETETTLRRGHAFYHDKIVEITAAMIVCPGIRDYLSLEGTCQKSWRGTLTSQRRAPLE
jgi:hypothetical protein